MYSCVAIKIKISLGILTCLQEGGFRLNSCELDKIENVVKADVLIQIVV